MDAKAAYLKLQQKMTILLEYLNVGLPDEERWGACFVEGQPCRITTPDDCEGEWQEGVQCPEAKRPGGPDQVGQASNIETEEALLQRMQDLLDRIHTGRCSFLSGGKTFTLNTTQKECQILRGLWEPGAAYQHKQQP
jgi:hypothetical protein